MPKQILKGIFELLKTVAIVIIMAFLLKVFLIQTFRIEGQSMEPNFHNGQFLLVDKLTYRFKNPARGDVVILVPPDNLDTDYIKRVIGLPGDTVEIANNQVMVNGQILAEPYLKQGETTVTNNPSVSDYKITLMPDTFFVLGDNRNNSRDSRTIGTVPKHNILGRALIILFPVHDFRFISHLVYSAPQAASGILNEYSNR